MPTFHDVKCHSNLKHKTVLSVASPNPIITRKCAVDYYTTAYRRSDTDVAYGGATWRVMFQNIR